jgi:hypothetical protein
MGRHTAFLLSGGLALAAIGCSDSNQAAPTSPEFGISIGTCDLSTAKALVNSTFSTDARTPAKNLIQTIGNSGARTETSTNAGFDLFASLAANGIGTASDRSTFVNAILPCQNLGQSLSLPIDFTGAFGANGAFAVRGGSATDAAAVVSRGGLWGLEPLLNTSATPAVRYTWDQITHGPNPFPEPPTKPVNKRFLAYGAPLNVSPDQFTNEKPVSTIFDWSTLPTLSFSPEVVVGACITDNTGASYLIQHQAQGDIVPSAATSFCSASAVLSGASSGTFAFARRVLDFFRPQPLLAAMLGTRPPGGSAGSLSPYIAIDPQQITLAYPALSQVADGRTGQLVKFTNGDFITVKVTPTGQTPMQGVKVRLIATTNLGATVVASGNVETTVNGVATFRNLTINKAGGYRLIATLDGFGQNNTAGYKFNTVTSNGFNLKQTK